MRKRLRNKRMQRRQKVDSEGKRIIWKVWREGG